jgi:hypothetical protein
MAVSDFHRCRLSRLVLIHPVRLAEEYALLEVPSDAWFDYGIGGFLNCSYRIFGIRRRIRPQLRQTPASRSGGLDPPVTAKAQANLKCLI